MKGSENLIALCIILGLILVIAAILSLYIHVVYKYDGEKFVIYVRIGPVRFNIFPEKKEKFRYRKLAKRLRGKKISEIKFISEKKKERNKLDLKGLFSDLRLDKMIEELANSTKNPEFTRILLEALKVFVFKFKHSLHSHIERFVITVDEKNAGDTCIRAGVLGQALSYLIEFLNVFSVLELPKEGNIAVIPCFDSSGYKFDIKGKFKIRIITVLSAVISSAFKSILSDIEKQANIQKRKDIKQ